MKARVDHNRVDEDKPLWVIVDRASGDEQIVRAFDSIALNGDGYAVVRFHRLRLGRQPMPDNPKLVVRRDTDGNPTSAELRDEPPDRADTLRRWQHRNAAVADWMRGVEERLEKIERGAAGVSVGLDLGKRS